MFKLKVLQKTDEDLRAWPDLDCQGMNFPNSDNFGSDPEFRPQVGSERLRRDGN